MSIQTRLRKQRYGHNQVLLPAISEIKYETPLKKRIRMAAKDDADNLLWHMQNPPQRDKYFLTYIYTVNKYREYLHKTSPKAAKQTLGYIVNWDMASTLLYMLDNPNRFGEFKDFKHAWVFNILCSMREFTLKQRYLHGEILSHRSTPMWSHGHEPFPKPMGVVAGGYLADILFDIIYPRVEYLRTLV